LAHNPVESVSGALNFVDGLPAELSARKALASPAASATSKRSALALAY
jgi:hypothetical protein